jgi:microcystin-dependent protein
MSNPFIGEIRMFGGNFAPAGWAFCNGQIMPISENDTLFNLIGTTYGGDGQETFALPNLQSRVPMHQGNGSILAETSGQEQVTLSVQQIPNHSHTLLASDDTATQGNPGGQVPARFSQANLYPYIEDTANVAFAANAIVPSGGSQPHSNMQPYLCINFIISLYGIYPPPN